MAGLQDLTGGDPKRGPFAGKSRVAPGPTAGPAPSAQNAMSDKLDEISGKLDLILAAMAGVQGAQGGGPLPQ